MLVSSQSPGGEESTSATAVAAQLREIRITCRWFQGASEPRFQIHLGVFEHWILVGELKFFEFFVNFLNISNRCSCSGVAVRFGVLCAQIEDCLQPLSLLVWKTDNSTKHHMWPKVKMKLKKVCCFYREVFLLVVGLVFVCLFFSVKDWNPPVLHTSLALRDSKQRHINYSARWKIKSNTEELKKLKVHFTEMNSYLNKMP